MGKTGFKNTVSSRVTGYGLGAAFLLATSSAMGATIEVNSLADTSAADSDCTLREAIVSANTNPLAINNDSGCAEGEATGDMITFSVSGTITLSQGALATTGGAPDSLNITGPITVDANQQSRIFTNTGATTLTDLTLINGMASGADADANSGGAVLNDDGGVLSVTGGAMNNNTSVRAGGAIEEASGAAAGTVAVTLDEVDFSGNNAGTAPGNGGVLHVTGSADVMIDGGVFDSNIAQEGGALWNNGGTMTIVDATISNNTANGSSADTGANTGTGGGGIFGEHNAGGTIEILGGTISGNDAAGNVASGGGIFAGVGTTLTVSPFTFMDSQDSPEVSEPATISGNTANRAGGGIEMRAGSTGNLNNVTMDSNIANVTDGGGGGNGGALHITEDGDVTITGGSFTNNEADSEGGGLWNGEGTMTISDATISGNEADGGTADAGDGDAQGGGGIFNQAGTVDITESLITDNLADGSVGSGGGIFTNENTTLTIGLTTISNNMANRAGGGIEARAGSTTTMNTVALSGNTANTTGGGGGGNGGGMHITGAGDMDAENLLVNNNTAASEGGGLWNSQGSMTVNFASIVNNTAGGAASDQGGGGVFNQAGGGTVDISNSRISGNTATGAAGSGGGVLNDDGAETNIQSTEISANTANRAGGGVENNGGTVNLSVVNLGGTSENFANNTGSNPGNGGGLHNGGDGVVVVEDSSVGFNIANEGGGLWNSASGSMSLTNTTVSNNNAATDGGGLYQVGGGTTTQLDFTTVANNSAGGDGGGLGVGEAQSFAFNVVDSIVADNSAGGMDDNFNSASTQVDANSVSSGAALGSYRLFGGAATAVQPLGTGSSALDVADATDCENVADNLDQRGAERPDGDSTGTGDCDVGAFEVAGNPVIAVTNNRNSSAINVNPQDDSPTVVLALNLANNGDSDVTVGGFSGNILLNTLLPEDVDLTDLDLDVIVDANNNGSLDSGEMPAEATATINDNLQFTVQFDGGAGDPIAAGDDVAYLLVIDGDDGGMQMAWATPVFAGGTLLGLLGLFSIGGIRRRVQWVLAVSVLTVGLAACGGDSGSSVNNNNNNDDNNPNVETPINGNLQFVAFTLDQPMGDTTGNDFIVGDGMPVRGPGLNLTGN